MAHSLFAAMAAFSLCGLVASLVLTPDAEAKGSRQKVIDFEGDVVEALNKRPLDSLSQLSERNRKKKKPHLYRKRVGFRSEIGEGLREMRYVQ